MRKVLLLIFQGFCFLALAAQKTEKEGWQLAVQTWTFHKYSLLETIHKADTLGLKYLEVYPGQRVGGAIPGAFTYTLIPEDRGRIRELLRVKGIQVRALGVIDKYYYTRDNLENYFRFAADMEIPFITAEPEWADLDLFNELAGRYKVKVALHCHPKPSSHYWHPDSTVKAMEGRVHIGAWPDLGHWARNGVDVIPALRKVQDKLWGMHLKDIRESGNLQAADTLLGKGVVNLPAVMRELKQMGFRGLFVLEYEVHETDNMGDLRSCIAFFNKHRKMLLRNKQQLK